MLAQRLNKIIDTSAVFLKVRYLKYNERIALKEFVIDMMKLFNGFVLELLLK